MSRFGALAGAVWALSIALVAALLFYALALLNHGGVAGLAFLFVTPAFLAAFACALIDPKGRISLETYLGRADPGRRAT